MEPVGAQNHDISWANGPLAHVHFEIVEEAQGPGNGVPLGVSSSFLGSNQPRAKHLAHN
jgi:hypothetical protein